MKYVIIGGGIAGVSCFEEVYAALERGGAGTAGSTVTLVTASPVVKAPTNVVAVTRALETFDVEARPASDLGDGVRASVCLGTVDEIDAERHVVRLCDGHELAYDRVCICTGAAPRLAVRHPLVLGIRDEESIETLARRLSSARRVAVVGNGGIALALVHELPALAAAAARGARSGHVAAGAAGAATMDVLWAVRDEYVGNTFFDASASAFFLSELLADVDVVVEQRSGHAAGAPAGAVEGRDATATEPLPWSWDGRAAGDRLSGCASDGAGAGVAAVDAGVAAASAADERSAVRLAPPLPQRVRRADRQRAAPVAAAPPVADAARVAALEDIADAPAPPSCKRARPASSERWAAAGDGWLPQGCAAPGSAPQPPTAAVSVSGAALGAHWADGLHLPRAAGAVVDPPLRGDDGERAARVGPTRPRLTVELGTELAALRGAGAGAVGPLADGRWHGVDELVTAGRGEDSRAGPGVCAAGDSSAASANAAGAGAAPWPLSVRLTNGYEFGCDVVVCATGVTPVLPRFAAAAAGAATVPAFAVAADGGLVVGPRMQTTGHPDVYAAGDAATVEWPRALPARAGSDASAPPLWFQMRTWGQARVAGRFAGRCMTRTAADVLEDDDGGVAFELFAHSTAFRGFKVVLLGLFNGQGLGGAYERAIKTQVVTERGAATATRVGGGDGGADAASPAEAVEVQVRVTPGVEYVKVVLLRGRVVGALLVGDTDLEETMENLILNGLTVTASAGGGGGGGGGGDGNSGAPRAPLVLDLLNPDVDIEDYFD